MVFHLQNYHCITTNYNNNNKPTKNYDFYSIEVPCRLHKVKHFASLVFCHSTSEGGTDIIENTLLVLNHWVGEQSLKFEINQCHLYTLKNGIFYGHYGYGYPHGVVITFAVNQQMML